MIFLRYVLLLLLLYLLGDYQAVAFMQDRALQAELSHLRLPVQVFTSLPIHTPMEAVVWDLLLQPLS